MIIFVAAGWGLTVGFYKLLIVYLWTNLFPLSCPVIQAAAGRTEEKILDVSEGIIISDTDQREAPVFQGVAGVPRVSFIQV